MRHKVGIAILLVISGICGLCISWYTHREQMPALTDNMHHPVSFVKQIAGDANAGEKIFREYCASCHSAQPIIEVHAPLINDKRVWNTKKKLGIPFLLKTTIRGIGAMPARGGCFECSDEQLKSAIQYMLQ